MMQNRGFPHLNPPERSARGPQAGKEARSPLYAARLIGRAAQCAVAAVGGGTIVAVFQRSLYIANAAGALACIGPERLGAGPLNLLCAMPSDVDWLESGLAPGAPVHCSGASLRLGDICVLDLSSAAMWHPRQLPAGWRPAALIAGLAALADVADAAAESGGFSPLVGGFARGDGEAVSVGNGDPLLRLARPGIAALGVFVAAALRGRTGVAPDAAAAMLLGLGPGLTPSGDDLVGGAMVALSALGRRDVARDLASWGLPLAVTRTGRISAAHLACAADGEASCALHDMLAALVVTDRDGIAAAFAALAAIGHSSGLDMLAGAALAAALVSRA
jgi:hypothetical protein